MAHRGVQRLVVSAVLALTTTLAMATFPSLGHTAETAATRAAATDLDVRPLGRAAAIEQCATKRFVDGKPRRLRVRYGMLQRTAAGTTRGSFVLRNHAGAWRFCDMLGGDAPSRMPMPRPGGDRVAVHATNPDWRPVCRDGMRTGMRANAFLRVQDVVRAGRTRFWVDGVAQPWFVSDRQGRFVHLQSWALGLPEGSRLKIQNQLLDESGQVLSVQGLSSRPQTVSNNCVQIG